MGKKHQRSVASPPQPAQRSHMSTEQDDGHLQARTCGFRAKPRSWTSGFQRDTAGCSSSSLTCGVSSRRRADPQTPSTASTAAFLFPVHRTRQKMRYQLLHAMRCCLLPLVVPPQSYATFLEFLSFLPVPSPSRMPPPARARGRR